MSDDDIEAQYQQVTDQFKQFIAVEKWEYAAALAEVDGLREQYLEQYGVWWESTRRPNGSAGGWVPQAIREFGEKVEERQRGLIDFRLAIEDTRYRYRMWTAFRDLGEVEVCDECGFRALAPYPEEYKDTMKCWGCGHTEVIRDVFKYRLLPSYE